MGEFKHLRPEIRGPVGWLRFNRPPRNAFDWEMLFDVAPAFEAFVDCDRVRVIVFASAIEGHFSAGADLETFKQLAAERMADWVTESHRLVQIIRASPKPVLAAIGGVAVGGGLEMSLHADLRFADAGARFGQPEINIAFIPPVGGTQGLVRLVGRSQAFRILYGGELMDAATAHDIGLVDIVTEPGGLEAAVQSYAETLAEKPANTLAAIRRCLIHGGDAEFDDGLKIERREALQLADHRSFQEGVAAFLEKRKPVWE